MTSQQRRLPQWMSAKSKDDEVNERKKSITQKNVLENGLPFLEFHGSILYSYEASDCSLLSEDIRVSLPEGAVIGFDIEWPPAYSKGSVKKVALIQLCVSEEKCYLFHISSMTGFPKGLKLLLEDEIIKKTGVGIEGDQWKLMSDFDIKLKGFVELAAVANQKLKCREIWSLNGLVKHLFNKQLLKEKSVRCSNWAQFPLSDEQKIYAATDAYAGLLIYQKLEKMSADEQILLGRESGMLLPYELKEQLVSVSQELLDLASQVPDNPVPSHRTLRAVDTLTGVLEKLTLLKNMLINMAVSKDNMEAISDPTGSIDEYKHQHNKAKWVQSEGPDLAVSASCFSKEREQNENGDECNQAVRNAEDPVHSPFEGMERHCLMSLDITEHELRMLEYHDMKDITSEEDSCSMDNEHELTCIMESDEELELEMLKDSHRMDNEHEPTCIIESDEELELEMLKSLEDVDKAKTPPTASEFLGPAESIHEAHLDLAVNDDDDEDEGIEEEEEDDWDPSLPEPSTEQIRCLKTYFGHSSFKSVQWKVIHSVLQNRRDNLVIMATGYGKSLCYQFVPVYTAGIGIVIAPLISLMEDQVLQLEMSNIPACFLGSAQFKNVIQDVKAGLFRVVYMTPEFCSGNVSLLQQLDNTLGITLIAIDEAHCISEWGHDFRSSYRTLGSLKKMLPSVPIVALTATASPSIREDIKQSLTLQNPQVTCTGFDRPNLYLQVGRKTSNISQDLQQFLIKKKGSGWEFEGPTIIYCPSRKTSEQVTSELMKFSIACGTYHAGMGIKARREVHHKFMRDEIQCVVATVAFGMGINKPDIRQVIHFGAPKEMESYYQEIGRAGRDGLPSSCHVLWTPADMNLNRHLLSEIQSQKFREYKLKMMAKMEKYLSSNYCRRKIILSHFEDKQLRKATSGIMGTAKCCDNCQTRVINNVSADDADAEESLQDFGFQAYQLMSAISTLGERFGTGVPVLFLRGSNSQRLPDKYRCHVLFGSGKDKLESWWKALARHLITEGFLKETSGHNKFATICILTQKGKNWLCQARNESRRVLLLQPNEELCPRKILLSSYQQTPAPAAGQQLLNTRSKKLTPVFPVMQKTVLRERFSFQEAGKISNSGISCKSFKFKSPHRPLAVSLEPIEPVISVQEQELQTAVYGKLVAARQKLASEKDIPPAVLATNKILVDMAKSRPTTVEDMKRIDGVSEAKSSMLAPLLEVIKEFCLANDMPTNVFPVSGNKAEQTIDHQRHSGCSILQESDRITYALFQEKNMSMREIADSRSLPLTVVGTHLTQTLKAGYNLDVERAGLTPQIKKIITDVIQNPPINSDITRLRAIRELVPLDIDLYLIRMTIALLEKECSSGPASQQSEINKERRSEPLQQKLFIGRLPQSSKQEVNEEDLTWIETELINTEVQQPSHSSMEKPSIPNSSSIRLASWNQSTLDAETEELFTDSQSQSSSPPAKRKLPEWFGSAKGNVSSMNTSKKTKSGTKKGLFG